ncbi:hypothetical protein EV13_1661 [Prochlorococcus sp. MIT 0702]|nr:hypothetical protein EV12_1572 [Prochlorococcus sp. MIT 0701]KGG28248.1 hypothetical protein EV13_1661 [Prochlorococcus sp. MIT 0702]KGG31464.1 hypothetical protein EV14_2256 [Prochlorococcus sp. MIT 0703]
MTPNPLIKSLLTLSFFLAEHNDCSALSQSIRSKAIGFIGFSLSFDGFNYVQQSSSKTNNNCAAF